MKLMAIDCEFNQPSKKVIQIGAVCFQPDNRLIVEEFMTYVNPGEPISQEIEQLTRITNAIMTETPHMNIVEAAKALTEFKHRLQINPIAIVWGAGKSNDVRKIYEEAGVDNPFKDRIIDVKAIFQTLANVCNNEMRSKVGLAKACHLTGIGWDARWGAPHDAQADAHNTMRLYMFLSHCLKGGFGIVRGAENLVSFK